MGKWHDRYARLHSKYVDLERKVLMRDAAADFAIVHLLVLNDALNIDPDVFGSTALTAYILCGKDNESSLYKSALKRELNNSFALYPVYRKEYMSKEWS